MSLYFVCSYFFCHFVLNLLCHHVLYQYFFFIIFFKNYYVLTLFFFLFYCHFVFNQNIVIVLQLFILHPLYPLYPLYLCLYTFHLPTYTWYNTAAYGSNSTKTRSTLFLENISIKIFTIAEFA